MSRKLSVGNGSGLPASGSRRGGQLDSMMRVARKKLPLPRKILVRAALSEHFLGGGDQSCVMTVGGASHWIISAQTVVSAHRRRAYH